MKNAGYTPTRRDLNKNMVYGLSVLKNRNYELFSQKPAVISRSGC